MDFEICYGDKYEHAESEQWVNDTIRFAKRYKLGNQLLVACHRDVVGNKDHTSGELHNEVLGDPTGAVWNGPDGYVALDELWQ
jgi:hypothetical protein